LIFFFDLKNKKTFEIKEVHGFGEKKKKLPLLLINALLSRPLLQLGPMQRFTIPFTFSYNFY